MKSSLISSASSAMSMRGLTVFISDIRQCPNKEAEKKRVDKELANIRGKFMGDSTLSAYQRKKYVWKMLYIHMLGYELDFGHMEAINLVSGSKYSEKSVGYLACTLLLHEDHELLALLINSMRNDILSRNDHFQTLALACICNIGSQDFAEALAPDVIRILTPGATTRTTKHVVKKRGVLCLLRLYRKVPDILNVGEWGDTMMSLLDERNMGVLTSAMGLFCGLVARNPEGYEGAVPKICRVLTKYVIQRDFPNEYTYYQLPSPWLQVKLLRALQHFPIPEDRQVREHILKVLEMILGGTELQKNVNKNNAYHAIFFEAIRLIIHLGEDSHLIDKACSQLGKYVSIKDSNLRYLGLETLARMAEKNNVISLLSKHQETILTTLFKENDISIRKRCLDLLYNICDDRNAIEIVNELLRFLEKSDYLIKEEVVLKIAVLSERYATDYGWYVDVILKLISLAGDFVAEDVWWRVVQIVTNNDDVQPYAASKVYCQLEEASVHPTMIKVGAHVLGEFADLIVEGEGVPTPDGGTKAVSAESTLELLRSKWGQVGLQTRAALLTSYTKLATMFPQLSREVSQLLAANNMSLDAEVQQRSCEYGMLVGLPVKDKVFEVLPLYPERESSVLKLIHKRMQGDVTDKKDGEEEEEEDGAPPSRPDRSRVQPEDSYGGQDSGYGGGVSTADVMGESAPPAPVDSLLDLVEPTPVAPAAAPAGNSLDDLFGGPTPVAPVGMGGGSGADAQAFAAHATTVATMRGLPALDGTLYEDSNIQVGIKAQFQGNTGKVALYYGNKSSAALTGFQSVLGDTAGIQIQSKPPPNVMGGGQQAQHLLMIRAAQPFDASPSLSVTFSINGMSVSLPLTLPVSPMSFITPTNMAAEEYFAKWKVLMGAGKDRQLVFPIKNDASLGKASMDKAVANLRLGVLVKVDPNPANCVGSGAMNSQQGPTIVLVRLEGNARDKLLRASVRSDNAEVSAAVEASLRFQLGQPE